MHPAQPWPYGDMPRPATHHSAYGASTSSYSRCTFWTVRGMTGNPANGCAAAISRARSSRYWLCDLWVGFAAAPGLLALQEELERALEPEGFAREERAFTPHLTLGRVKGPGHVKDALAVLAKNREKTFGDMTVRRVALFESRLHPEGAEYRIVHEAGLG